MHQGPHHPHHPEEHPHDGAGADRDDSSLVLTTVGVDIGSSTTHFLVSRLRMTLHGARYVPAGAELLHESPVLFTPYAGEELIDVDRLRDFITQQYAEAGIGRQDVDSGAVLLTGLAAQRQNARLVGEIFADEAGRFVACSAGHRMEAELGVRGSGALALSRQLAASLIHIDIGGGTTKISHCRAGRIESTLALAVGARLILRDRDGLVRRVEPGAKPMLDAAGVTVRVGQRMEPEQVAAVCGYQADRVLDVVAGRVSTEALDAVLVTDRAPMPDQVDAVTFSGGVSEYLYGRESQDFGDLGPPLAEAFADRFAGFPVREVSGGIRATVLGASRFTVQVSSQTIFVDPLDTLPVRNVPAVVPELPTNQERFSSEEVRDAVARALDRQAQAGADLPPAVAIGIAWEGDASHARLDALARGILAAVRQSPWRAAPLLLVVDHDIARLLGLQLRESARTAGPVVAIDGVGLRPLDFVDIGEVVLGAGATLVVVKSLVFSG
ncbi:MAG: ethanolamine utilization protein EutA [Micromonosporaceae bacterium]|nr:ethanolamine utilization protein EutA [Micromonosporaceae bacterium]